MQEPVVRSFTAVKKGTGTPGPKGNSKGLLIMSRIKGMDGQWRCLMRYHVKWQPHHHSNLINCWSLGY